MVAAELIGVPVRYWVWVLILAIPATALGVFVYSLLEQGFITMLRNQNHKKAE